MALVVRNTRDLPKPENYKMKLLVVGLPGSGKSTFLGTVPDIGIAACETGEGNGLLGLAQKGIDFVEPSNHAEFEIFCAGGVFKEKSALGIDSLTEMTKNHVQTAALAIPRKQGDSMKRRMGVPELDDYGIMGEFTRRLLRKLIDQDKHIICTALLKVKEPPEGSAGETFIGPDLPGAMFLGAVAMFDLVLVLRTRPMLRDPKDAKSRYNQRYFVCEQQGQMLAKCRPSWSETSLLDQEEIFDLKTGQGTFPYLLDKITSKFKV